MMFELKASTRCCIQSCTCVCFYSKAIPRPILVVGWTNRRMMCRLCSHSYEWTDIVMNVQLYLTAPPATVVVTVEFSQSSRLAR
jgi:hypothetical protein